MNPLLNVMSCNSSQNNNDSRQESQKKFDTSVDSKQKYLSLLINKGSYKSSPDKQRMFDLQNFDGNFVKDKNAQRCKYTNVKSSGIKSKIKKNHSEQVMDKILNNMNDKARLSSAKAITSAKNSKAISQLNVKMGKNVNSSKKSTANNSQYPRSNKKMSRDSLKQSDIITFPNSTTDRKTGLIESSINFGKNPKHRNISCLEGVASAKLITDGDHFSRPPSTGTNPNNTRRPQIIIKNYLVGENKHKDGHINNSIIINDKKKKPIFINTNHSALEFPLSNQIRTKNSVVDPSSIKESGKSYAHKNPLRQFFDGVSGTSGWSIDKCDLYDNKRNHKKNALSMMGGDSEWANKFRQMHSGNYDYKNSMIGSNIHLVTDKKKEINLESNYQPKSSVVSRKKKKAGFYSNSKREDMSCHFQGENKDPRSRIKEINNNINNNQKSIYNHGYSTSMQFSGDRNYNTSGAFFGSNKGTSFNVSNTNANSVSMLNHNNNISANLGSKMNITKFLKQNTLEIFDHVENNQNSSQDIRNTLEHNTNSTRPTHFTKVPKKTSKDKSLGKSSVEIRNQKNNNQSSDVNYLFKKFQKNVKLENNTTSMKKQTAKNVSQTKEKKKNQISNVSKKSEKVARSRPLTMGCNNDFDYMELPAEKIDCQEIIDNLNKNRKVLYSNQNSRERIGIKHGEHNLKTHSNHIQNQLKEQNSNNSTKIEDIKCPRLTNEDINLTNDNNNEILVEDIVEVNKKINFQEVFDDQKKSQKSQTKNGNENINNDNSIKVIQRGNKNYESQKSLLNGDISLRKMNDNDPGMFVKNKGNNAITQSDKEFEELKRKYISKVSSDHNLLSVHCGNRNMNSPDHNNNLSFDDLNFYGQEKFDFLKMEMDNLKNQWKQDKEKIPKKYSEWFSKYSDNFSEDKRVVKIRGEIEEAFRVFKEHETTLKYYKVVKILGKGSFGKVYLALQRLTNRLVAIKCLDKETIKEDSAKLKVQQEVIIMKNISSSNQVIRLLEVFENSNYVFFVMEYAPGGDLLKYVKKRGKLSEHSAKKIFADIVVGLISIHRKSILHRDIKLDNILLDKNTKPKICDFGVSRFMSQDDVIREKCGTPAYIAPEIIEEKGYSGFTADAWSLGVQLYAMTTGSMPFRASTIEELHRAIQSCDYQVPKELGLSPELEDMITSLLVREPTDRIPMIKIFNHPWQKSIANEEKYRKLIHSHLKNSLQNISKQDNENSCKNCKVIPVLSSERILDNSLTAIAKSHGSFSVNGMSNRCNCKDGKHSCSTRKEDANEMEKLEINEDVLDIVENYGFKREHIIMCVTQGRLNHASACYFNLIKDHEP